MSLAERIKRENLKIVFNSDDAYQCIFENLTIKPTDVKGRVKTKFQIIVYSGNEGNYATMAHFHVVNKEEGRRKVDTCFRFTSPVQFNHGAKHNCPITSKDDMKEVIALLTAINRKTGNTVFVDAINAWNACKESEDRIDINTPIPDYLSQFN